jgi:hypothetical protein
VALHRAGGATLAARLFGRGTPQALALMRAAWTFAVGADTARRTELLAIEGNTLRVRVPDARWRKVLHRMQPEILARLRQLAGDLAPRRLGFSEGPLTTQASPEPLRVAPPSPAPKLPDAIAREAATIGDPETRARFERSAALYLSRTRGSDA